MSLNELDHYMLNDRLGEIETQLRSIAHEIAASQIVREELNKQLGRLITPQRIRALMEVACRSAPPGSSERDPQWDKLRGICMVHLKEAIEDLSVDLMEENEGTCLDQHVDQIKALSAELARLRGFGERRSPAVDGGCE
jgi:hypothetical protein